MSNYPPGVTGNEPQIAGYPTIDLEDVECVNCEKTQDYDEAQISYGVAYWECAYCGHENEREFDDEPDPDDWRDMMMDRDYDY